MLLKMGAKAAKDRHDEGKTSSYRYCIVLTKCDRASDKLLRATLKDIEECTGALYEGTIGTQVPVVVTSAIDKKVEMKSGKFCKTRFYPQGGQHDPGPGSWRLRYG